MTRGRIAAPSYRKVYAEGCSESNRLLVLYYLPEPGGIRMGVSVPARLGKATVRNRLRRQVKEAFRLIAPAPPEGQFVFIVRRAASETSYRDIAEAVKGLVKRMKTH